VSRRLEVLDPEQHDRAGFDCGVPELNAYLQRVARQHSERGISKTFVLIQQEGAAPRPILGFFSLAACEMEGASLPTSLAKKLPQKVPAIRLGRLAVAKSLQGQKLGSMLLYAALEKVAQASQVVGLSVMCVDAKDEAAAAFYAKFGFLRLPGQLLTLCLPITVLHQTLAAVDGGSPSRTS
jgi:ribosomal protein S18 acetylase RimI-like enzyme